MADQSGIDYILTADGKPGPSWGPWRGCTKVSAGCMNCFAARDMKRLGHDPTTVVRASDKTFRRPLARRRDGTYHWGDGSRVFVCPWGDFFHADADKWRAEAWNIIWQRPGLMFIIPTKRPERIAECLPPYWGEGWPNVWLLVSVENQEAADLRIPQLLKVPAAVRGVSAEPLLGYLDLTSWLPHLSWVPCGGESGPNARPMHPDWARGLRDQCQAAGVKFWFKQWGEWVAEGQNPRALSARTAESALYIEHDGSTRPARHGSRGNAVTIQRVTRKRAGHLLDGREWNQAPESTKA